MKRIIILISLFTITSIVFARNGNIVGAVYDKKTKKPLPGANVFLKDTGLGATSFKDGKFYIVNVPPGYYLLKVTYVGYLPIHEKIKVDSKAMINLDFYLEPKPVEMSEVVIVDKRGAYESKSLSIQSGVDILSIKEIESIPIAGEPDLIKAVQTLPGVAIPNQVSGEIHARGGASDQNLVLYDGAVIYNLSHLWGLSSIFNPDVIKEAQFSNGGFSAAYGDRLSSVLNIKSFNHTKQTQLRGNVSLLSSKFSIRSSLNNKFYWNIGARRSYYDVLNLIGTKVPYYFGDLNAKITYIPNKSNVFYFSTFYAKDQLLQKKNRDFQLSEIDEANVSEVSKEGFKWNNRIAVLGWEMSLRSNLAASLHLSQSISANDAIDETVLNLNNGASASSQQFVDQLNLANRRNAKKASNSITDKTFRATVDWGMTPKSQWQLGVQYSDIRFNYSWDNFTDIDDNEEIQLFFDNAPDSFAFRSNYSYSATWLENLWEIGSRWTLRSGLRGEIRNGNRLTIDPRLNLRYNLSEHSSLKFAVGSFHQSFSTARETGVLNAVDLLFPTEKTLKTPSSFHYLGGLDWKQDKYKLSIDGYYKTFDNLFKARDASLNFDQIPGKAWGIEARIIKKRGRLNGELFYTFSKSLRGQGEAAYYANSDQRHRFQVLGNYQINTSWKLNFRWVFATGQPFTSHSFDAVIGAIAIDPFTAQPVYNGCQQVEHFPKPGSVRFPFYHRLDITLSKRIQHKTWAMIPYINILNTYRRKNPVFYNDVEGNFNSFFGHSCNTQTNTKRKFVSLPIIPTIGVRFEF